MIPVSEVIGAVVTALESIPEVAARFGEYGVAAQADDELARDLTDAIDEMQSPALLVIYDGFGPGAFGSILKLQHKLTLVLRLETVAEYHQAAQEILFGIPAVSGEELPFLTAEIHPDLELSGVPTFGRLLDSGGTELWQISLSLIEQGG